MNIFEVALIVKRDLLPVPGLVSCFAQASQESEEAADSIQVGDAHDSDSPSCQEEAHRH